MFRSGSSPPHPSKLSFLPTSALNATDLLWVLTAGLRGWGYLQVLRSADIQACDVLNPPVDLVHHWVVKGGKPGTEQEGPGEARKRERERGENRVRVERERREREL